MLSGRNNRFKNNTQQSRRPVYSFPELKNGEILQCMEELGIPLSEHELIKPNSIIVQRIFESFSNIFMGEVYKIEDTQTVVESLENPELFSDSVNIVAFNREIVRLMIEVGIDDYSLNDLIKPEPHRLKIILSAAINFAKFREEQLGVFEEFSKKADETVENKENLVHKRDDLVRKLNNLKQKHNEAEPAVAVLKQEISEMISTLKDLKKNQVSLSNDLENLKEKRSESSEKMNQTQFLLSSIKEECSKLKSRIVHSPEKLMQIITEMKTGVDHEKHNLNILERKSRELQMKLEALSNREGELLRTLNGLEILSIDLKKYQELEERTRDEKISIERKEVELKDLELKSSQLSRQLNQLEERQSKLYSTQTTRRARLSERLQSLQKEYDQVSDERKGTQSKIEENEKIVKEYESKITELRRKHDHEIVALRNDFVSLKAKSATYIKEVCSQI